MRIVILNQGTDDITDWFSKIFLVFFVHLCDLNVFIIYSGFSFNIFHLNLKSNMFINTIVNAVKVSIRKLL